MKGLKDLKIEDKAKDKPVERLKLNVVKTNIRAGTRRLARQASNPQL